MGNIRVYYVVQNRLDGWYGFKEEVPQVFEERGFLTGHLVGDVGSKTVWVGGGWGSLSPGSFGWGLCGMRCDVYVRGVKLKMCDDVRGRRSDVAVNVKRNSK